MMKYYQNKLIQTNFQIEICDNESAYGHKQNRNVEMHRCNFCEIQNAFNIIMKIFIKKLDLCNLLSTYSKCQGILNKHSKQKESLNTVLIIYTIFYLLVYMIKEKRNLSKMRRNNKNTQGIKSSWCSYQKISRLSQDF